MKIYFTIFFVIVFAICQKSFAIGVPEIANRNLPDIAMVTTDNFGRPFIVYNPILCHQAGAALCEFYRWHEYGHIQLGHTFRQMWPQAKELEADCWAAENAPIQSLQAAYQWFIRGGGASPVHGNGPQRAERIKYCSGL